MAPRDDFYWSYTDEPHASRRKLILAKYPQIKELFGYDPKTKYIVTGMVLTQIVACYMVGDWSWKWLIALSYVLGGTINHSLNLAIHEITHNLAFRQPIHNKWFGMFANLPIPVATSITFPRYHMEHHQFQGVENVDVDIPTRTEGLVFTNTLKKLVWVILQPFFYALRPMLVNPKQPTKWDAIAWTIQLSFDALIVYFFGLKSLAYLGLSSVLGLGLHPCAGHFIAEHYVFVQGQETYSYYGPLNWITFNVGYHNEHHDFPRIPGSRLPIVRKVAAEFYDTLPHHNSWVKVIYDYITDPRVGPFSRVMRKDSRRYRSPVVAGATADTMVGPKDE